MNNIELARCRYCGGEPVIIESHHKLNEDRVVIVCKRCGITLDHTQDWYTTEKYDSKSHTTYIKRVVAANMSAIDIWNGGMLNEKVSK